MKIEESNPVVKKWLEEHKGFRTPVRAEGQFESYRDSKASCCWGQNGPIKLEGGIELSVCKPSPNRGSVPVMFYDYRIN